MPSVVTNRDRDCFACRVTSGAGLAGAGVYLKTIADKNPTKLGKAVFYSLAISFTGLGMARMCDLPPFKHD